MLKSKEIEILRECVEKLGADSYCGPWLRDQIPFIESDIRSDFLPTPSWTESKQRHDAIVRDAKDQADRILAKAKAESDRIRAEGAEYAKNIRIAALNAIERAVREINSK